MTVEAACLLPEWPVPANVRALVTTRYLPVDLRDATLVHALGLPATPCWLRQIHATDVAIFTKDSLHTNVPQADTAITRDPEVVLAILSADCLPLLVAADDSTEIAAIHAGWRGLAAGVIESCIKQLRTPRDRLVAWMGPAIGPQSYEVGDEVRAAFLAHDRHAATAFTSTRPGHWLCNLYTLAGQRLQTLGINKITGGGFDTFTDTRFYSYRRDKTPGRCASLIWITA